MSELLKHHQIALIHAENGPDGGKDFGVHMVRNYARRIAKLRSDLGVSPT